MGGVTVAWEDVFSVISQISGYLIAIGVLLVAAIVVIICARKVKKPKRGLIRKQTALAFVLLFAVLVNGICLGPMKSVISAVFVDKGDLTDEIRQASFDTVEDIASEGIVMLKNDGGLPLTTRSLNVFGWASTAPVYGGTGSGSVDTSTATDILGGLTNAGFSLNDELSDLYRGYRDARGTISINDGQDWTLPEPPADRYSDSLLANARDFSDTAVIVLGRVGGEGADLPHDMGAVMDGSYQAPGTKYLRASYTNNSGDYADFTDGQTYLELSRTERDMVELVTANFDNVVVVYNGSNPLEMGWVDEYEQIHGVFVCPAAGATGFNALGKVLTGEVDPSGKTVDTWVYDLTATPYYNNIGHFGYTNVSDVTAAAKEQWEKADGVATFVDYVENIYVGYRFYETAAAEGFLNYDAAVQYPFGYGLSYTSFSQSMGELQVSDGAVTVDVTVTNTGAVAGKDVIQLYFDPPYTDGGIEKASANLAAFDKTDLLEPGASQTVTLNFTLEDMASFDAHGAGCYVLEAGDYQIRLNADSHTVLDTRIYTQSQAVSYDESNPRSTDAAPAVSRLDFAEGGVTYLSRQGGFANYAAATAAPTDYEVKDALVANGTYDPYQYNNADDVMPTTGAKNGLELYDLRGADYDDPRWDTLLDQLTVPEMVNLIANGGYQTAAVNSVNKVATVDADGPAGINSSTSGVKGTGYCSEIFIAQTWNTDMALAAGKGLAAEALSLKVNGWYGPSMNLHRSAFAGRNFEYYSEDGLLSAKMAAAEIASACEEGVYPYIKHFAFNDQETNRNAMLCTWLTEQSARELYLKPFEACVKANQGKGLAIMSSYNFLGTDWAAANPALQRDILRDEWGFRGMVLSDYFGNYGYMDADRAIRGGTDIMLGTAGNDAILTDQDSATSVLAMRQASKNVFYTAVNSGLYANGNIDTTPTWQIVTYCVDGGLALALVALELLTLRSYSKKKKEMDAVS